MHIVRMYAYISQFLLVLFRDRPYICDNDHTQHLHHLHTLSLKIYFDNELFEQNNNIKQWKEKLMPRNM